MIRTAVLGATGRMGQALLRLIASSDDFQLAGAGTEPGHAAIGRDAADGTGAAPTGILITDQPDEAVADAQVAIDFTLPNALTGHLEACVASGSAMVIGTTGLTKDHEVSLSEAAERIAIVYGRNMSIGVNVLTALARRAAEILDTDFDIEITEAHHRFKIDAPSGTALQLGEAVAAGRGTTLQQSAVYGRHGQTGERERGSIGIHALRGGRIVGDHSVLFAADEELLELRHRAQDRAVFARGALYAANWVHGQAPGLYGMSQVLGLN